ncbi:MAG: hypothetical protein H6834_05125 [Planctomycetes bacterium]|nr:hypothetical protein [Planctomycetota bacterium]
MTTNVKSEDPPRTNGSKPWVLGLAVFLAAFLLYVPSIATGTFILDDVGQVLENQAVRQGDVGAALTRGYWQNTSFEGRVADARGDLWRPVTTLSVLLSFQLFGETAWPYHLENALWHALAAWLALLYARRLTGSTVVSVVTGLLFAVAPIHVEAVCGVILRNELMAAVFGLGFLLALARARTVLAALCLLLALGAKESAIALPLAAVLVDRVFALARRNATPRHTTTHVHLVRYAPSLIAVTLYLALRLAVLGQIGIAEGHGVQYFHGQSWLVTWLTMARFALAHYVVPALLGWPLVFDFSYETFAHATTSDGIAWFLLAAFTALVLGSLWLAWQRRSLIALGIALTAILIAPTSNALVKIGVLGAHRLFYFPYLGLAFTIGLLAERLLRSVSTRGPRVALAAIATVVLAWYGLQTVRGQLVWSDVRTFWEDVEATSPTRRDGHGANALGWANLCTLELESLSNQRMTQAEFRERLERAHTYGERALDIDPARTWPFVAEPLMQTGWELKRIDDLVGRIDAVLAAKRAGLALEAEIRQIEAVRPVLETFAATQRELVELQRVPVPTRAIANQALITVRRSLACFPGPLPDVPAGIENPALARLHVLPRPLAHRLQRIRQDLAQTHDRLVRVLSRRS